MEVFNLLNKKYSAQLKISLVEEYLKLAEESKISKAEFAASKGISDSTFNDWVIKYKRQGQGFCNITNEILKLNQVEIVEYDNNVVKIIDDPKKTMSVDVIRLTYNGATIEFDQKFLERVLNVLKTW